MPKRVTSGRVHLRVPASGRQKFEEMSRRWGTVGDTACDLTGLGIEPRPTAPKAMPLASLLHLCF